MWLTHKMLDNCQCLIILRWDIAVTKHKRKHPVGWNRNMGSTSSKLLIKKVLFFERQDLETLPLEIQCLYYFLVTSMRHARLSCEDNINSVPAIYSLFLEMVPGIYFGDNYSFHIWICHWNSTYYTDRNIKWQNFDPSWDPKFQLLPCLDVGDCFLFLM